MSTWNFKSRAEIEAAASRNGHVVSETRENGGRGCVHAKAPHGCGRVKPGGLHGGSRDLGRSRAGLRMA